MLSGKVLCSQALAKSPSNGDTTMCLHTGFFQNHHDLPNTGSACSIWDYLIAHSRSCAPQAQLHMSSSRIVHQRLGSHENRSLDTSENSLNTEVRGSQDVQRTSSSNAHRNLAEQGMYKSYTQKTLQRFQNHYCWPRAQKHQSAQGQAPWQP